MNTRNEQPSRRSFIDIHHHIAPPIYKDAMDRWIREHNPRNVDDFFAWTPERSIETMDQHGVAAAVTTISTPGVWFGNVAQARKLARECNEFAAKMIQDTPGRFGFLAVLPMPDIDGTLEEIRYAYDILGADGVGLMSNFGRVWPGDPSFAPVFDDLNRRRAVVYVHPVLPEACENMIPGIGESTFEYLFDTVRAIASLLYNGSFRRWPDIKFIFPHAGGAMIPMAERVSRIMDRDRKIAPEHASGASGALSEIKNLYYDVATSTNRVTLTGLLELVPIRQVVFGTDFPFMPSMSYTIDKLLSYGLSEADLKAIENDNAKRLFPRFSNLS